MPVTVDVDRADTDGVDCGQACPPAAEAVPDDAPQGELELELKRVDAGVERWPGVRQTPDRRDDGDVVGTRGGLEFHVSVNSTVTAKGKTTPVIRISAVESKIPRFSPKPVAVSTPTTSMSTSRTPSLSNGKVSATSSVRARREASIVSTSSSSSSLVSKMPVRKKSNPDSLLKTNSSPSNNSLRANSSSLPRLKSRNNQPTASQSGIRAPAAATAMNGRSSLPTPSTSTTTTTTTTVRPERSPPRPPRVIGVVPKTQQVTSTPAAASKRRRLPQKPVQDESSSSSDQSKLKPVKSLNRASSYKNGDEKKGKSVGRNSSAEKAGKGTSKLNGQGVRAAGGGDGGVAVAAEPPPEFADVDVDVDSPTTDVLVLSPPTEFSDASSTPCTVVIQEPDGETDSSTSARRKSSTATAAAASWRRVGSSGATAASILSPVMPDVVLVSVPAFSRSKSAGDLPSPVKCDKYQVEEPDDDQDYCSKYIDQENIFQVMLNKTSQGLGLSIMGGAHEGDGESDEAEATERHRPKPKKGFIRIKKIYPMTPAWESGNLLPGDILLSANGVDLTGLTCSQALEILRTTPRLTVLDVCRLPVSVEENKAPPPTASHKKSSRENLLSPILSPCGEFEVTLTKVNGSLGFTLRKEDDSVLGHYIRALVKEPAISNGRLQPGDKIVSVNGVDISGKTHAEAVAFLRSCPDVVTLRLYRDMGQTPVSPLSPTVTSVDEIDEASRGKRASRSPSTLKKNKLKFRQEAQDMLKGLALQRGKTPPNSSPNFNSLGRQRKLKQMQNSSASSATSFSSTGLTPEAGGDKPKRPTYLDLNLDSPGSKKQKFVFTPPSSYRDKGHGSDGEGTSLDASDALGESPILDFPDLDADSFLNEVLDACDKTQKTGSFLGVGSFFGGQLEDDVSEGKEDFSSAFGHRTQGYQSVNLTSKPNGKDSATYVASTHFSDQDIPHQFTSLQKTDIEAPDKGDKTEGTQGLLKWRGTVFNADPSDAEDDECDGYQNSLGPPPPVPPPCIPREEQREIILTLQRGWNSRLGFSLRCYTENGVTGSYVSAIYADSVAHRDGRLKVGDRLIRVNTTDVGGLPTSEVISILRTLRGTILLTLVRPPPAATIAEE